MQPDRRSSAIGMRIFIERSVAQGNDGCAHVIWSWEWLALNQSIVMLLGRLNKLNQACDTPSLSAFPG
jgi:hypothetical protein